MNSLNHISHITYRILQISTVVFLFFSCGNSSKKTNDSGNEMLYKPKYATGFYIEKSGNEKLLHISNPWQGAKNIDFIYHLYPRDSVIDNASQLQNYIPVPVERVVCLSSTHIAFIDCIGKTSTIVGVSGKQYITNADVCERAGSGEIRDVGYETLLSYETVVSLQPDVVFAYGVNGEMEAVTAKLNEMGCKVVYLADYLEESVLGKAEYMVAVSAFYNEEKAATEQFLKIDESYNTLAEKMKQVENRPSVILNAPWRDTWYMPGDENYMNKLLYDAGAQVIGARSGRDSSPLSLEAAYTYSLQADYWLHPNYMRSLQELAAADKRFATIPAFINRKVFNNTKRSTPGGGSDFWESGVVNPHIILQDLVTIFHPAILPAHELVYYEQLQ